MRSVTLNAVSEVNVSAYLFFLVVVKEQITMVKVKSINSEKREITITFPIGPMSSRSEAGSFASTLETVADVADSRRCYSTFLASLKPLIAAVRVIADNE